MSYTVSATDLGRLRFNELETVNSVLQNIAVILSTPKGTVPLYREFGLDWKYLDKPMPVAKVLMISEVREAVEESGKREYREALGIREYLHLEGYDKRVMASLIESAKVMGEDRLEVVWKFGDFYEKILGEMR